MGLEDLEGCERFFSKSNSLAASVRHASVFHRKQKIVQYIQHVDSFETSQNLSASSIYTSSTDSELKIGNFLVNNYRQALEILGTEPTLRQQMVKEGITDPSTFATWLQEEKAYLKGLSVEPVEETQQMEYYQKLVNLEKYEYMLHHFIPLQLTTAFK